ncbi:MAG: FMN-binding negative transcriptional regulator [Saprospiraceae bacterium]|nr:FMN-binding negative transcriptional regulator [Saprospiraceae bacterium]
MYVARINEQLDPETVRAYVRDHGFATLVSTNESGIFTTHTPLEMKIEGDASWLFGHVARANEQVASIISRDRAVAIFMDTHSYISSSWYDHINVPTWNYISVHMHGVFEALDEEATLQSLQSLVSKYEKNQKKPFSMAQMGEKDLKAHLRGLVAFRIKVEKIEASWKLSQNRDANNFFDIIRQLKLRGDDLSLGIAAEMEKLREA